MKTRALRRSRHEKDGKYDSKAGEEEDESGCPLEGTGGPGAKGEGTKYQSVGKEQSERCGSQHSEQSQ